MTEKPSDPLQGKVIFFNTFAKLEDTQFSAHYRTQELIKTPRITEMHNHRFERLPENSKSGHWIKVSGSMCSHTKVIKGAAGGRNEAWIFFPFGNITEPWTFLQNSVNLFQKSRKIGRNRRLLKHFAQILEYTGSQCHSGCALSISRWY